MVALPMRLVLRLRGPDHWVVKLWGTVLPELLILYLFFWKSFQGLIGIFFEFFWAVAGPGFKNGGRGSSRLPMFTKTQIFLGPTLKPPFPTAPHPSPEWGDRITTAQATATTTITTKRTKRYGENGHNGPARLSQDRTRISHRDWEKLPDSGAGNRLKRGRLIQPTGLL